MGFFPLELPGTGVAHTPSPMLDACRTETTPHHQRTAETLNAYSASVRRFLARELSSSSDADDVFSQFCEDLWRGLETFEGRCSLKSWVYILARNAAHRHRRYAANRPQHRQPLSDEVIESTPTPDPWTSSVQRDLLLDHLVAQLPEPQQRLVELRVRQELSWRDIARRQLGPNPSAAALEREAARLRKVYQQTKAQLRELAQREGLLQ